MHCARPVLCGARPHLTAQTQHVVRRVHKYILYVVAHAPDHRDTLSSNAMGRKQLDLFVSTMQPFITISPAAPTDVSRQRAQTAHSDAIRTHDATYSI